MASAHELAKLFGITEDEAELTYFSQKPRHDDDLVRSGTMAFTPTVWMDREIRQRARGRGVSAVIRHIIERGFSSVKEDEERGGRISRQEISDFINEALVLRSTVKDLQKKLQSINDKHSNLHKKYGDALRKLDLLVESNQKRCDD